MPAASPHVGAAERTTLAALGGQLRTRRQQLRVSMVAAAEAAGISRVTLHRIERGEPSVTMGAYLSAAAALGLSLSLTKANAEPTAPPRPNTDAARSDAQTIDIHTYPQLRRLAWHLPDSARLAPREALSLYERNWRHLDTAALEPRERELLNHLIASYGGGLLLV